MQHIFLTGEIQCGKSTLIQSILRHGTGKLTAAGGFLTYFTSRNPNLPRTLYLGNAAIYGTLCSQINPIHPISPLQIQQALTLQNDSPAIAAEFSGNSRPQISLDAFNIDGKAWIEQGLENALSLRQVSELSPILVFDECGYLEANAVDFHQAVYSALEMPIPILGVIRQMTVPSWLDTIRNHPNVQLISVTQANRDALVPQLTRQLLSSF